MNKFVEKQRFTQWYIWLFFAVLVIKAMYPVITEMLDQNSTFIEIAQASVKKAAIPLTVSLFIAIIRLKTLVSSDGIQMSLFPLSSKKFLWKDIVKAEVISYNPYHLLGRGIRSSVKYGTVYNISGKQGLYIKLKNGKKYLIGTRKADAMQKFLDSLAHHNDG